MKKYEKSVFWFRRDLRLTDNAGLYQALKKSKSVVPIFIFDTQILEGLENKKDARVQFIYDSLMGMSEELRSIDTDIHIYHGDPTVIWKKILKDHTPEATFYNKDYEPYALARDTKVKKLLKQHDCELLGFKDHIIFEGSEVLKADGTPYTVFTPYKRKWLEKLHSRTDKKSNSYYFKSYPTLRYKRSFAKCPPVKRPSLKKLGFEKTDTEIPSATVSQSIIKKYDQQRNFPAIDGTSRLGIHFRFGTISIREKARKALQLNDTYLSELVWRDFYSQILQHFPHVVTESFRAKYDRIPWRNNKKEFQAWCDGLTGYPMVDAGMRELNQSGHMHNRVRMVVASFLTKHLLIDWRWGEGYFAERLLDFDLASNNGGWQWAAGGGTDAAPYFRIFNPSSQLKKFDPDCIYVKKWVPEFGTSDYPEPIVDHKYARERCLSVYKEALNKVF